MPLGTLHLDAQSESPESLMDEHQPRTTLKEEKLMSSSSSLRILHVSTWQVPCGIATYCGNLVKALNGAGVHSEVFTLQPHAWTTYLPIDIKELQGEFTKRIADFDLIHFQHEHGLYGASIGMNYAAKQFGQLLTICRNMKKPVITTFHTEVSPGSKRTPKWMQGFKDFLRHWKWRSRVAHHFGSQPGKARAIVHSSITRYAFAKAGLPIDSIHVLPHACLPKRELTLSRADAKKRLGLPVDCTLLTLFGFVGSYKGHDLAVSALKRLPRSYRLAVCGGSHPESKDGYMGHLMNHVKKAGLSDRVTVTGWIANETADLYYAATDICLAPYRPYSNLSASGAITWALSSGRPTIASKIDAFQAVQREQECMMMTTPEATVELAWAIEKLAKDPQMQERLVAGALRYVDKYSWPKNATQTIELYDKLLGRTTSMPRLAEGTAQARAA